MGRGSPPPADLPRRCNGACALQAPLRPAVRRPSGLLRRRSAGRERGAHGLRHLGRDPATRTACACGRSAGARYAIAPADCDADRRRRTSRRPKVPSPPYAPPICPPKNGFGWTSATEHERAEGRPSADGHRAAFLAGVGDRAPDGAVVGGLDRGPDGLAVLRDVAVDGDPSGRDRGDRASRGPAAWAEADGASSRTAVSAGGQGRGQQRACARWRAERRSGMGSSGQW